MKYVPRKEAPNTANKYYYSSLNPFYVSGYGMPNCTAYAFGRFSETLGSKAKLCTANAENWFKRDDTKDGVLKYQRGPSPRLGAIAVWSKGIIGEAKDGAGHVAVVEQIKHDGTIITSNSVYKGSNFYLRELKPPYKVNGYKFEGFIYNPNVDETPVIEPTPDKFKLTRVLKEGCKGVDVLELKNALDKIYNGYKKGIINKNNRFGEGTKKLVIQYQKDNNILNSDPRKPNFTGNVGENTAKALGWDFALKK